MSELSKEIVNLRNRFDKISQESAKWRLEQIDSSLRIGAIHFELLTFEEVLYIHTRLHFFYHMQTPPITKETIIKMHSEIISQFNHSIFDHLDNQKRKI